MELITLLLSEERFAANSRKEWHIRVVITGKDGAKENFIQVNDYHAFNHSKNTSIYFDEIRSSFRFIATRKQSSGESQRSNEKKAEVLL